MVRLRQVACFLAWCFVFEVTTRLPPGVTATEDQPQEENLNFHGVTPAVSGRCFSHAIYYALQLQKSEPWALQMLDSTTKLPDGFLLGNINQLGSFDECLAVRVSNAPGNTSFQGGFCRAALTIQLPQGVDDLISPYKNMPGVVPQIPGMGNQLRLMWALCLPSSCSPEDVTQLVEKYFPQILEPVTGPLNLSVKINPEDCYVEGIGGEFDAGDWVIVAIELALLVLVIVSTILDYSKTKMHPMVLAFSGRATGSQLFSTKPEPGTLGCLHGIRVCSMLWVIWGHRYVMKLDGPVSNVFIFKQQIQELTMMTWVNAALAVDTFFLLSGLLMCYVFLRDLERGRKFDTFLFYFYRYFRLVVPMIFVIIFYMGVLAHMGTGPVWNGVKIQEKLCLENWWANLLYVNNYFTYPRTCLSQTWYLSVDMQLAWLSPLILLPLFYAPRAAKQIMFLLVAISCFLPFTITYLNNYFWAVDAVNNSSDQSYKKSLYIPTHARATPYLCGLLLGYYLFKSKKTKLVLANWQIFLGWTFSTVTCLACLYCLSIGYQDEYVYNHVDAAFYGGFHRLGWSLGLIWIIIACVKGYGGFVDKILSWNQLQPFSRLTYGAYLTHIVVVLYDNGSRRTANYFSHFECLYAFLGDLPIVFGMAVYLYFTVEGPLMAILRIAFDKGPQKPAPKPEETPAVTGDKAKEAVPGSSSAAK